MPDEFIVKRIKQLVEAIACNPVQYLMFIGCNTRHTRHGAGTAVQLSWARGSRVSDAPNNRSNEACSPSKEPPRTVRKMQCPSRQETSLPFLRTGQTSVRIPNPKRCPNHTAQIINEQNA